MASMTGRLKKGDISLSEVLALSYVYYGKFDNKLWRAGLDCHNIYIVKRQNYHYDRVKRTWIQDGREAKIVFRVVSKPISYKRIDTIKKHVYPVTFLFRDISMGEKSAIRWRTGSLKHPIIAKKGKKYTHKQRIEIANKNIKRNIQLDFFFNLEYILQQYGLLYGPNYAKWLPRKSTNIEHYPYFDKTSLYVVIRILLNMLGKSKIINKIK
jgi:hypothetical protein